MALAPIGWRPTPSETVAIRRAVVELNVNRSTLLRTAVNEWLQDQQRRGVLSKGTATAFN